MAILTGEVAPLIAYAEDVVADTTNTFVSGVSLSATASAGADTDATSNAGTITAVGSLSITADVVTGVGSFGAGSITFDASGTVSAITKTVPVYAAPTGTVDNIEDLPVSPPAGAVYEVLGLAANRSPVTAIWDSINSEWIYQPILSGRNTRSIQYVNTSFGISVTMPNYINFSGAAHAPAYWSTTTLQSSLSHSLIDIVSPDVQVIHPSRNIWRWKVEDLPDPGTGSYQLKKWPEHSGTGPSWESHQFYRPRVKNVTKFNNKKRKRRKQRSVNFYPGPVDHMWMNYPAGIPQPFTFIVVGIIHSYPTAKFGHYILDTAKETPIFDANKTGKDFFFNEGATPRNVMLYQRKSALIAVNNHPNKDLKKSAYIRVKHTYRSRPRMFYGVFNGSNSLFGARDRKSKFHGKGTLLDLGNHKYFSIGRRVNRVSDNRASHMSVWEIILIRDALTKREINDLYQELSNYYQFKKYR